MDAFVTTDSGRMLDIEMQRAEHSFFVDRAILYKAFLIIKGKQKMEESDEWAIYSRNSIQHGKAEPIFPKNRYIMVSLQNFNKKAHEVKSVTDVWIYLLKNAGSEKEIPNFGSDIVKEALERIRVDNLDDETLKTVEREMTTKEEMACCLAFAKRKMAEEVRKEITEEVRKEITEDLKKEMAEDAEAERREMIVAMLAEGLSVEKVVRISKLPESEVLAIKASLATQAAK